MCATLLLLYLLCPLYVSLLLFYHPLEHSC